jgi:hypothetical protein
MSTDQSNAPCPFKWPGNFEGSPMEVFLTAAVDSEMAIGWHLPDQNASSITIMFGRERLSLEFFDEESLRRLRNVADDAIPRLREVLEETKQCNAEFLRTWHAEQAAAASAGTPVAGG